MANENRRRVRAKGRPAGEPPKPPEIDPRIMAMAKAVVTNLEAPMMCPDQKRPIPSVVVYRRDVATAVVGMAIAEVVAAYSATPAGKIHMAVTDRAHRGGTPAAEMAERFVRMTVPPDAGADQADDIRFAFVAGAFSILTELREVLGADDIDEDAGAMRMQQWSDECEGMIEAKIARDAVPPAPAQEPKPEG